MSKLITLDMLAKANACADQVETFKELFGESVELTEELVVAHAATFDIIFVARNLLSEEDYKAYNSTRKALWKTYDDARILLWKTYEDARAIKFFELYKGPQI